MRDLRVAEPLHGLDGGLAKATPFNFFFAKKKEKKKNKE
jgi:hypothetical protein